MTDKIEQVSREVFELLKSLDNPQDAAAALIIAHYRLAVWAFPAEDMKMALVAIDGDAEAVKMLLRNKHLH